MKPSTEAAALAWLAAFAERVPHRAHRIIRRHAAAVTPARERGVDLEAVSGAAGWTRSGVVFRYRPRA